MRECPELTFSPCVNLFMWCYLVILATSLFFSTLYKGRYELPAPNLSLRIFRCACPCVLPCRFAFNQSRRLILVIGHARRQILRHVSHCPPVITYRLPGARSFIAGDTCPQNGTAKLPVSWFAAATAFIILLAFVWGYRFKRKGRIRRALSTRRLPIKRSFIDFWIPGAYSQRHLVLYRAVFRRGASVRMISASPLVADSSLFALRWPLQVLRIGSPCQASLPTH